MGMKMVAFMDLILNEIFSYLILNFQWDRS